MNREGKTNTARSRCSLPLIAAAAISSFIVLGPLDAAARAGAWTSRGGNQVLLKIEPIFTSVFTHSEGPVPCALLSALRFKMHIKRPASNAGSADAAEGQGRCS
jgi:hypothetical protein